MNEDFRNIIEEECRRQKPEFLFDRRDPESLAHLGYESELRIKNAALKTFFRTRSSVLHDIEAAPQPRHYRGTTKRRGRWSHGRLDFVMANGKTGNSLLEPDSHESLYRCALAGLNSPKCRAAAQMLNHFIIRGDGDRLAVIINVRQLSGDVVRSLKAFASGLAAGRKDVSSCHIYLDESGSDYYLESDRPESGKVAIKKLFGPSLAAIQVGELKILHDVTSFAQVNTPMLERFCNLAMELLEPGGQTRMLDLYCGCGLFSLFGAVKVKSVFGIDYAADAIRNAAAGAAHIHPGRDMRYISSPITAESLRARLPAAGSGDEVILLDPPRSGTSPGVIETLCSRRSRAVLHIFCGIDVIPKELGIWENNGYRAAAIRPLDLFPGTAGIETLVLLRRAN